MGTLPLSGTLLLMFDPMSPTHSHCLTIMMSHYGTKIDFPGEKIVPKTVYMVFNTYITAYVLF